MTNVKRRETVASLHSFADDRQPPHIQAPLSFPEMPSDLLNNTRMATPFPDVVFSLVYPVARCVSSVSAVRSNFFSLLGEAALPLHLLLLLKPKLQKVFSFRLHRTQVFHFCLNRICEVFEVKSAVLKKKSCLHRERAERNPLHRGSRWAIRGVACWTHV